METIESNPIIATSKRLHPMQGPRTKRTAWAVIQATEAVQMIRKGQVLGITRDNRYGCVSPPRMQLIPYIYIDPPSPMLLSAAWKGSQIAIREERS